MSSIAAGFASCMRKRVVSDQGRLPSSLKY